MLCICFKNLSFSLKRFFFFLLGHIFPMLEMGGVWFTFIFSCNFKHFRSFYYFFFIFHNNSVPSSGKIPFPLSCWGYYCERLVLKTLQDCVTGPGYYIAKKKIPCVSVNSLLKNLFKCLPTPPGEVWLAPQPPSSPPPIDWLRHWLLLPPLPTPQ